MDKHSFTGASGDSFSWAGREILLHKALIPASSSAPLKHCWGQEENCALRLEAASVSSPGQRPISPQAPGTSWALQTWMSNFNFNLNGHMWLVATIPGQHSDPWGVPQAPLRLRREAVPSPVDLDYRRHSFMYLQQLSTYCVPSRKRLSCERV